MPDTIKSLVAMAKKLDTTARLSEPDFPSEISGTLSRVIWRGNGYVIGLFYAPAVAPTEISVKGNMLAPQVGMQYDLVGEIVRDPKFGQTFVFTGYKAVYPTDAAAIALYLQSSVKWIGPTVAGRITAAFGEDALTICREDPARVAREIKGISDTRADEISEKLREGEKYEQAQILLKKLFQGVAVPRSLTDQLITRYGTEAYEAVKSNPFLLIGYSGIGFPRADLIAQRLGFAVDSPYRIQAGILHTLYEARNAGHTYLPLPEALLTAQELLGLDEPIVSHEVLQLVAAGQLATGLDLSGAWIADAHLHAQEEEIAWCLGVLRDDERKRNSLDEDDTEDDTEEDDNKDLAEDQKRALRAARRHRVLILTGAPGTGKTYTVQRILRAMPGHRVALAAPTGKAAARLSELTGRDAVTIHRLLEPQVTTDDDGKPRFAFSRSRANPIEAGLVVIDEASMLDVSLACSLLRAVAKGTRVIFVGDVYQLPAVGPGNVLKDMIAAGIPSVELTEIKRQDAGLIVRNCHKVKDGMPITIDNGAESDFFFVELDDPFAIQRQIVGLLKSDRLRRAFGADPLRDCQVLSPLRSRGDLSCDALNKLLQGELNGANRPGDDDPEERFWVADKVIQTKNDYDNNIINGDIGYIDSYTAGGKMLVAFENPTRQVELRRKKNELALAYAVTVHKYQGSEAKVILMPVHNCLTAPIYQRNLIYTAISRAQKACILLGQLENVHAAAKRNDAMRRFTWLQRMIEHDCK